ncbi:hypothetical protein D9M71_285490 [compost metagenome]
MDGAAFIAERCAEALQPQVIERASCQAFVQVMGRFAAPGVEAPAHTGQAILGMADKARAGIAAPTVVHCQFDQFDVAPAQGCCTGDSRGVDDHFHRFEPGDGVGHAGEVFLHLRQGNAPTRLPQRLIVRPHHPGGGVQGPFCRHPPALVLDFILLHDKHPLVKPLCSMKTALAVLACMLRL